MKVSGRIEAISKEAEHNAPSGWYLARLGGQDILVQVGMTVGKIGETVEVECVGSKIGLKAQSITKIDSTSITAHNDYTSLYNECKEIIERTKKSIWDLGKRLLDVETSYGKGTIQRLAKDLHVSDSYLYNSIRVAEKYPTVEKFHAVENLPIEKIVKSTVEKPRSSGKTVSTNVPAPLPVNPSATPQELEQAYKGHQKTPLPKEDSQPERQMRFILETVKGLPAWTSQDPITIDEKTYHADFLVGNRLVIEVDSDLHNPDKDCERDKALAKAGYETRRFNTVQIQIVHDFLMKLTAPVLSEVVAQ